MPFVFSQMHDWPLEPRSVYLALHHQASDPQGEFHWAIVMTMDGHRCLYYHLKRLAHSTPYQNYFETETIPLGRWYPYDSGNLLCMFLVRKFLTDDGLILAEAEIRTVGLDIFTYSTVSPYRSSPTFGNRTWALDVLERVIARVSKEASTDFEICCQAMAIETRESAVLGGRPQALYAPGVYAVYTTVRTTLPPMSMPTLPGMPTSTSQ
ncbi:hypothetical protein GGS26DRAFT_33455 [Hypomontagnella submonticulosa]|nr:hypothetical protein GGS26DRAFT_33455 [Hypomontagnella submonticulosa]